jgi:hypothetical protein
MQGFYLMRGGFPARRRATAGHQEALSRQKLGQQKRVRYVETRLSRPFLQPFGKHASNTAAFIFEAKVLVNLQQALMVIKLRLELIREGICPTKETPPKAVCVLAPEVGRRHLRASHARVSLQLEREV